MTSRLTSPTIIGRQRELAAVSDALDRVSEGGPLHLLVAGEAGVGKSRLIAEATAVATARGMRVLSGGCANIGDGGLPFGPIVEALRTLVRDLDPATLDTVVDGSRADLARLVPSLGPATPDGAAGGAQQSRLFEAVLGLFHRLSAIEPVVLVVEDLHWADPATREIVAFLVRQIRTDRVLVVMTFRADELHRRHPLLPWLAELERSGRVVRIDLERLDLARTRELMTSILGAVPPPDAVARIHQRSDGNPFFVEELLMAGQDDGTARLPPTLREILLARIAALPENAQAIVGVAAVGGRQVDHELLLRVAGTDEAEIVEALRIAFASQILVADEVVDTGDGYAFRHALIQEAAYEDLLPGERQRLHRAFGEALAARRPGTGAVEAGYWAELAYHWSAARDDRRAFEASVRAGDAAARSFAFADARRHDEAALERWTTVDDPAGIAGLDRIALLDRAAQASWLGGDARRSVALRREALNVIDREAEPLRTGLLLERLGRALWTSGDPGAALSVSEQAVAVMPAEPPTAERARVLSGYGQMLMLHDRWAESVAVCEEAVAIAVKVGARQAEGHARNTLGLDYAADGRCKEAEASLRAALAIATEIADADDIGRAYVNLTESVFNCGDTRRALDIAHEAIQATEAVGVTGTYGSFVRENAVTIAFELGEWTEAARLAEDSALIKQAGEHQERYLLGHWVRLLVATGDPRAAVRVRELGALLEGQLPEPQFHAPYRVAQAESALWAGDPDAALAAARQGLAELDQREWHWYLLPLYRCAFRAVAELADVARARRDPAAEAAARAAGDDLWADLQPIAAREAERGSGGAAEQAAADMTTIEADRRRAAGDPTIDAWSLAADRWRARGNPYLVADARWHEGEARLTSGDRPGAATALAEARDIAAGLGARPMQAAVEALAARARIVLEEDGAVADAAETTSSVPADPFGLTARERDVLPLLLQGRTNRQIAESLFISESTAGVHVSNIIGKLGATSRTEAATIAVRLRLDRSDEAAAEAIAGPDGA